MNEKRKMNTKLSIISTASLLILALASCNNPTSTGLSAADSAPPPAPETGINVDPAIGLIAGLSLEGDAILDNPDVFVSDGVEWVEGLSGNAMFGDEDGDYLRIADGSLPELTITGSVEMWVKPEGITIYSGILHKGESPDVTTIIDVERYVYFIDETWSMQFHEELKPYFFVVCENEAGDLTTVGLKANNQIGIDSWSHLAATWVYDEVSKKTDIKLYVNGSEADVTLEINFSEAGSIPNNIGPVRETDGDLIVGSQIPEQYDAEYGHLTFMGLIDEVSLFDDARTPEEVLADYQVYASIL
ncbi:MAG: LamG domain-containing protein [Spirochaetaceae bacterium]|nr:LamG domain-containing protein [Spirochaetaceae bacterium]